MQTGGASNTTTRKPAPVDCKAGSPTRSTLAWINPSRKVSGATAEHSVIQQDDEQRMFPLTLLGSKGLETAREIEVAGSAT